MTIDSDNSKGSVSVFGLGTRFVSQITLESNYLLQQMDKIFHGESDREVKDYVESIKREEINLSYLYENGRRREDAYNDICDAIITEAKAGYSCGYLTPGNPIFLNTVVLKLRSAARESGIPFFIYSGVSSLDTLLTDLFLPVGETGLQVYECTHFVKSRPIVDNRIPLVLFQPAVINMYDVFYQKGAHLPGLKILQDILVELYGEDSKWYLLRSAIASSDSPMLSSGTLSELMDYSSHMELGTLLIPGNWSL